MTRPTLAMLVIVLGLAGCGDPYPPSAPSPLEPPVEAPPPIPQASATLHQFTESATGFSTTDLRDAQDRDCAVQPCKRAHLGRR